MTSSDPTLTLAELARELGVSAATLYDWRYKRSRAEARGEIPATSLGPRSFILAGRVRYRRADIEEWLAACYASAV